MLLSSVPRRIVYEITAISTVGTQPARKSANATSSGLKGPFLKRLGTGYGLKLLIFSLLHS
jgi:hypothetical protein